ncbi:MAG: nitroreductase [Gemmatimonadales bacterium]
MNVLDTIRARRSIRSFADTPVARDQVEALLDLAVMAPNHRMTQPWRFLVLGAEARRAYGQVLGGRKAKKVADPEAARTLVERTVADAVAAPLMIAVTQTLGDNPEVVEEDFATCWMAIQNILLGAVELGLGTHLRTGAVFNDPAVRSGWGVADGERVIGVLLLGHPQGPAPEPKARVAAAERTTWLP